MMIVNDDSSIINNLVASLTDDARVVIYYRHMFIGQATEHERQRNKDSLNINASRRTLEKNLRQYSRNFS